ncbi:MAG TPA: adenosylcobinamide-GDP ribazoletransferase [Nitrososphaera sp.]|nr:adenosylcobinamide-GDP ribazoletransferase [Nitrososphaera sp.]
MASLKPIQSVLAFLTILPVGKQNQDIYYIAKNMYLFPVVGLLIGTIIGAMALGISNFLHPLLIGFLVTGALVIITGVHHTDALADFADGLMAKGSKETKHKAMLDPAVGSAGVAVLVMYFVGMIIVFNMGFSSGLAIFTSIITAEVIAKYVMVLLANRGISAWEGFSSPFTAAMKDRYKMVAATSIMITIVWLASSYAGFVALIVSLVLAQLLKYVSSKSFGGISGDVFGASNEITRLSSLMVLSSLSSVPQQGLLVF